MRKRSSLKRKRSSSLTRNKYKNPRIIPAVFDKLVVPSTSKEIKNFDNDHNKKNDSKSSNCSLDLEMSTTSKSEKKSYRIDPKSLIKSNSSNSYTKSDPVHTSLKDVNKNVTFSAVDKLKLKTKNAEENVMKLHQEEESVPHIMKMKVHKKDFRNESNRTSTPKTSKSKESSTNLSVVNKATVKSVVNNIQSRGSNLNDSFDLFAAQEINDSDLDARKYENEAKVIDNNIDTFSDSLMSELLNASMNRAINCNKSASMTDDAEIKIISNSHQSEDVFEMSSEKEPSINEKNSNLQKVITITPANAAAKILKSEDIAVDTPPYSVLCQSLDLHSLDENELSTSVNKNVDCLTSSKESVEDIVQLESGVLSMTRSNIEKDLKEFNEVVNNGKENRFSDAEIDSFCDSFFETSIDLLISPLPIQKRLTLLNNDKSMSNSVTFGDCSSLNLTPTTEALIKEYENGSKSKKKNVLSEKIRKSISHPRENYEKQRDRTVSEKGNNSQLENSVIKVIMRNRKKSFLSEEISFANSSNVSSNEGNISNKTDGVNNLTTNVGSVLNSPPCLEIIDVVSDKQLFDVFINEWKNQPVFALSLSCEKAPTTVNKGGIGKFNYV